MDDLATAGIGGKRDDIAEGEVSLSPAPEADWGIKVRAEHGCGSEKPDLETPTNARVNAKTRKKGEWNHEPRVRWEIPVDILQCGFKLTL
jgi:hypothetical protein